MSEDCNSDSSKDSSSDNDAVKKTKKIKHSMDFLKEKMKPTEEELKYREVKLNENDVIDKSLKFFHCTKCKKNYKPILKEGLEISVHPFLGVLMCYDCCDFYGDGDFSLDTEGEDKYCRWCGEGGTIFTCSKCISGFCSTCIKKHLGTDHLKSIENDDNWLCFFCNPKPLWSLRFICALLQQLSETQKNKPSTCSLKATPTKKNEKSSKNELNTSTTSKVQNLKDRSAVKTNNKSTEQAVSTESNTLSDTVLNESTSNSKMKKRKLKSKSLRVKRPLFDKNEKELNSSPEKIKRTKYIIESSDEDEQTENTKSTKKIKKDNGKKTEGPVLNSSFLVLRSEIMEKLETILKLAEYQMAFAMNWISKSLRNISDSNYIDTPDGLLNEIEKTKWFLSLLSSHLVEFCESLNSVEKILPVKEKTKSVKQNVADSSTKLSSYSDVIEFLKFIDKLVKVSAENGFALQDLINSKMYNDSKILGIIKKNTSLETIKSSKKMDEKNNEISKSSQKKSDDSETDFNGSETLIQPDDENYSPCKKIEEIFQMLTGSESEKNKTNVMDILKILENA